MQEGGEEAIEGAELGGENITLFNRMCMSNMAQYQTIYIHKYFLKDNQNILRNSSKYNLLQFYYIVLFIL